MSESPYSLAMQVLDEMDPMLKMLTGVKARIVAEGFTDEQAGDLTVEIMRQATIYQSKEQREEQA